MLYKCGVKDLAYQLEFDEASLNSTQLGRALKSDQNLLKHAQLKKINQHSHNICYPTSHYLFQAKAISNWQPLAYLRSRAGLEFIPLIEVRASNDTSQITNAKSRNPPSS